MAPSTRKIISEKAKSNLGPTSVFHETFDETGGILGMMSSSDVPRDMHQISNERRKLKKKQEGDKFLDVYFLPDERAEITNRYTWSPVELGTQAGCLLQVANIRYHKMLLWSKSKNVFAIDTVYNVGDYYVTTTTYENDKFVNIQTQSKVNLPGPALFHIKQDHENFLYFCHTILQID